MSGICIAHSLAERGIPFELVSNPERRSSSRVAGGLINPVIGMRFSLPWNITECLEEAKRVYSEMEALWNVQIYHQRRIYRMFKSAEQRSFWDRKRGVDVLAPYAQELVDSGHWVDEFPQARNEFGAVRIEGGGWLNFPTLLITAKKELEKKRIWRSEEMKESMVRFTSQGAEWRGTEYGEVIDCRGFVPNSEWWNFLPWRGAKGEILTVRTEENWPTDEIWSREVFIVPLGGDCYRIGATYSWDLQTDGPTEEGKSKLLERLQNWIPAEVLAIDHRAGVRPILKDKFPVLGEHPDQPHLWIMNGLGARGGTTAPWLSRLLLDHIFDEVELPEEIRLNRTLTARES